MSFLDYHLVGLFFFKIQIITFNQIFPFFSGKAVLGHLYTYRMIQNERTNYEVSAKNSRPDIDPDFLAGQTFGI
jgi:hypothetical protein